MDCPYDVKRNTKQLLIVGKNIKLQLIISEMSVPGNAKRTITAAPHCEAR